jgi:hypothetical protein
MTSTLASRSFIAALLPIALAAAWPAKAHAQPAPTAPQDPYDADDDADDDAVQPGDQVQPEVAPNAPAPNLQPPAPPSNPPPPQAQQFQPQPQVQASASGQWVYTQQRGWLWMPYGDQYVYAPPAVAGTVVYPYEYVYAPAYGWTWVSAPWVWGWGPRVYFSIGGPVRFAWWHRHPFIGHRFVGGHVIRPGFRGGFRGHIGGGHFSGRVGGHFGGRHR